MTLTFSAPEDPNHGTTPLGCDDGRDFGTGWHWGDTPSVEGGLPNRVFHHYFSYPLDPYLTTYHTHDRLVLTFSRPVNIFGFEATTAECSFVPPSTQTITAVYKDSTGTVLGTVSGSTTYPNPASTFCAPPVLIAAFSEQPFTTVEISASDTRTGALSPLQRPVLYFARLRVGPSSAVEGVEITQAIQQYQKLDDLKTSLKNSQEPPVPIISGKPAVLRTYFKPVDKATTVKVHLSGIADKTQTIKLPPNCTPEDQRASLKGCRSADFYFTPPAGAWIAHIDLLDSGNDPIITQRHDLQVMSRATQNLRIRAVSVCDARDGANWQCQKASSWNAAAIALIGKIAPTKLVNLDITKDVVRRDTAGILLKDMGSWWEGVAQTLNGKSTQAEQLADAAGNQRTVYFGAVRPVVPGTIGGNSAGIPSHGAASRTSTVRMGQELKVETFTHELAHTLGVKHTNTDAPAVPQPGPPPGCYFLAPAAGTDWPFADNRIQSTQRLEVGFDVVKKKPLDPNKTFDIGSYCSPRWISPIHYKVIIETLAGGAVRSPSRPATARSNTAESGQSGQFWLVAGTIQGLAAIFEPLFQLTIDGNVDNSLARIPWKFRIAAGSRCLSAILLPFRLSVRRLQRTRMDPPHSRNSFPLWQGLRESC